jgi:hypothetical protein
MPKFKDADIEKWPDSWAGFPRDEKCGRAFLPLMKEFIDYLKAQNLSPKTINKHIDNLWLLGGAIIGEINLDSSMRKLEPLDLTFEVTNEEGGPMLKDDRGQASFDGTCRKFHKYLIDKYIF